MFAAKLFPDINAEPNRAPRLLIAGLLALLLPLQVHAQVVDLDLLPWTLDSDSAVFDGKTSTMIYTGLRFSQGDISIESDEGRATTGTEKNRNLKFTGNVVILVNGGRISCDQADLQFDGSVLSRALVSGSPATFRMQRDTADDVTYAEAGKLVYDVPRGLIEFSDQALITENGQEISSNSLVYNIRERSFNASSSGDADRVRITYTPTTEADEAAEEQAQDAPDP